MTKGMTLIELTLSIALTSVVLLVVAQLTRTAFDQRTAWASSVEPAVEVDRFFDALEEALTVGDRPDAAGRVEIREGAIRWMARGVGPLEMRFDALQHQLLLGPVGGPTTAVFENVRDFSAAQENDGRSLRLAWTVGDGDAAKTIERRVELR